MQTLRENGGTALINDTYDAFERPESRATAGNAMTFLGYDGVSRLNAIEYQFAGLADDLTAGFGYNPAGQLIRQHLSNGIYRHAGTNGNAGDYVVNGLNQYHSVSGASFAYDANGNLTSDGSRTHVYDVENRLISVSGGSPAVSATLSYDPMGRLYRYTANGTTTDFLYDGDSMIAEYQSGTISKRYVHGTSVDTPLIQYTGSTLSNRQFLHKNHQGSVIAASGNTDAIAYINTYDAYGVPATGNQGRFGYTGQMYLPELKLYHYRARVYNPNIGRFLQVDPIGYEDQINLYAYVGNDPMNARDPSGMKCEGTGDKSVCTIDQINIARYGQKAKWVSREEGLKSGKISERKLTKLEGSLTKAYKAAQKLGDNSVKIRGNKGHNIQDISITGKDVEKALSGATLRANYHQESVGQPGPAAQTQRREGTITFNTGSFLKTSDGQTRAALHESFHLIEETKVWKEPAYLREEHQDPFNDAAQDIMDF